MADDSLLDDPTHVTNPNTPGVPLDRVETVIRSRLTPEATPTRLSAVAEDSNPTGEHVSGRPTPPGLVVADRYRLIDQLGEGGMGTVYRAEQTTPVRRVVAVKLIKPWLVSDEVSARFGAERQALALMDHPNIAKVLDAGTTSDGRPFFVMELVQGPPITKYCDAHRLPLRDRLGLFVDVCEAVQHAHLKGVIHRDLKPNNVLVAEVDGRPVPKVIDFGLAKAVGQRLLNPAPVTLHGVVVGTPEYMAPEQADTGAVDVDTRADVYALGVLLYELLTGSLPYGRRLRDLGLLEALRVIRSEDPPAPSERLAASPNLPQVAAARGTDPDALAARVRGELDWITRTALAKDRSRRYETANALAEDVGRYLADEPVAVGPPGVGYRLRKFAQKNRWAAAAAGLVVLALAAGTVGTTWQAVRATRAEREAREALAAAAAERDARDEALRRAAESGARAAAAAAAEGAARAEAQDRDAEARAVAEFLAKIVRKPDPKVSGREVTVADVLGQAAAELRADRRLSPRSRAAIEHALGLTMRHMGESDTAAALVEDAWRTRRAVLGPADPDTLASQNNLALVYRDLGRSDEAVALLREVYRERAARLKPTDALVYNALFNLTQTYRMAGRSADAEPFLRDQLALERVKYGTVNKATSITMSNLGLSLLKQGKYAEAELVLRECLAVRERLAAKHQANPWRVANAVSMLGEAVFGQGKGVAEAERLLVSGYEGLRADPTAEWEAVRDGADRLVAFYTATGQPERAKELAAKVPREPAPMPRPAGR